ncbi:MAG: hypothetical protein KAS86_02750 [Candidatus Omnitrophica bacterium]|nr:hypothetical protein [Candidatus Omnitrophota bacterium]
MVVLSFLIAICVGTLALSLPIATRDAGSLSLVDSLFTATSATCVTGLVVRDTGSHFTPFGRWVIFALFQAGGLGIMTFSTLFAVMLGRRIGFREDTVVRSTLGGQKIIGLKRLILYILGIAFTVEAAGALLLYLRWRAITDWAVLETLEKAVFHSVSGFCNAGFALFRSSFVRFEGDPLVNMILILLIFIGGIGFIVILDVIGFFFRGKNRRKISLQAKVALITSIVLIIAGACMLFFFEKGNVMKGMTLPERLWGSVFQSVTARTAGFNTLPIGELTCASLMFLVFLMFIGASPGSTGGGIKTCTFTVLAATVWNMLRGRKRVLIFNRSIPRKVIREALIIFFLSASWIFIFTIVLACLHGKNPGVEKPFIRALFEVVSAFSTVGLSTGMTAALDNVGKLCITATMFAGRIGPLTLALAIAFKEGQDSYIFPEENIMVG